MVDDVKTFRIFFQKLLHLFKADNKNEYNNQDIEPKEELKSNIPSFVRKYEK